MILTRLPRTVTALGLMASLAALAACNKTSDAGASSSAAGAGSKVIGMAGAGYLLNVLVVVVIGGASLAGGVFGMGGTFVGLLIIGVLNNGMSLLHIIPNLQPVVVGAVTLAAVLSDRTSIKLRG